MRKIAIVALAGVAIGCGSVVADVGAPATAASRCACDCDGNRVVTVDEFMKCIRIAEGSTSIIECLRGDANKDGEITVDELIAASAAMNSGCPK